PAVTARRYVGGRDELANLPAQRVQPVGATSHPSPPGTPTGLPAPGRPTSATILDESVRIICPDPQPVQALEHASAPRRPTDGYGSQGTGGLSERDLPLPRRRLAPLRRRTVPRRADRPASSRR